MMDTAPLGKPAPRGLTMEDLDALDLALMKRGRAMQEKDREENYENPYYIGEVTALGFVKGLINDLSYQRWLADGSPREGGD